MNFLELANKRFSVRDYKQTPVAKVDIEKCIQAARLAPSACNSQPWKFIVIDEPQLKNKVAENAFKSLISMNKFAFKAPVLIIITAEKQKLTAKIGNIVKKKDFRLFDIGIAAEHFCLQAAELGLGTCMLGWFNEKKLKKLLSIPTSRTIELMISVGYSESDSIPKKNRKELNQILTYNSY
ncbi:MAG: nitroreductase family protein [Planctomycetes bacterium]|nr:nitroreductase family protein [Planctomycetota bacterium]